MMRFAPQRIFDLFAPPWYRPIRRLRWKKLAASIIETIGQP